MNKVNYFFDTEFTDLPWTDHSELISIGIVSDNGKEFYAVSRDFKESKCSNFVKEQVLPLLTEARRIPVSEIVSGIIDCVGDDIPEFWAWFASLENIQYFLPNLNLDEANNFYEKYANWDFQLFKGIFGANNYPDGWPNKANDLNSWSGDLSKSYKKVYSGDHNALVDANNNYELWRWVNSNRSS